MRSETLTDIARAIARAELEGRAPLSRVRYRLVLDVAKVVQLPRPETESALDLLAIRGLVEQEHDDTAIGPGRPQRYRWARGVTVEALERFADSSSVCEAHGCRRKVVGKRFCTVRCERTMRRAARLGAS